MGENFFTKTYPNLPIGTKVQFDYGEFGVIVGETTIQMPRGHDSGTNATEFSPLDELESVPCWIILTEKPQEKPFRIALYLTVAFKWNVDVLSLPPAETGEKSLTRESGMKFDSSGNFITIREGNYKICIPPRFLDMIRKNFRDGKKFHELSPVWKLTRAEIAYIITKGQ